MAGGSGRGNKGYSIIQDENRPDCPACGGFMKSNVTKWRCTDKQCDKSISKRIATMFNQQLKEVFNWGFDTEKATLHARRCETGKRLIVTSAQNNTDVNANFLKSLKQAAKYYKCEIAAIPIHYKNITAYASHDDYEKEWAKEIRPYLLHTDVHFGNHLIRSDVRINATTLNPLSGKQAHGGDKSVIFGHTQVALEPVATPADHLPKRLFTTGAVTLPNYTVTDAGEKAKFHHTHGALILEKVNGTVFVRQLNCDESGTFYDLDKKFTPRGTTEGNTILSLVTGDEHSIWNIVENETYKNKNSIVKTLKPSYIIRHDVLDGYAGSHHHLKDPMIQFKKFHEGTDDYRAEVQHAIDFINRTTPGYSTTLLVPSNHHDHLKKYLDSADANKDHRNAMFILEMNKLMREAALNGDNYDPFMIYAKPRLKCKFEFLSRNEAALIGGVDVSQHGDVGANGSRGSARGLAKSTYKMTIGHSHSARICQGVFQVGSSTGRLEYERGLSDHSTTHVLQYKNGKRTIVDIINRKWRL